MYYHVFRWMIIQCCYGVSSVRANISVSAGYRSLVDRCICDFIHCWRCPSEYRMDRPIFAKGGPSPRMRALASQDSLTRRKSAVSFGVNRRSPDFDSRVAGDAGGSASFAVGARDVEPSCTSRFFVGIAPRPGMNGPIRIHRRDALLPKSCQSCRSKFCVTIIGAILGAISARPCVANVSPPRGSQRA